MQSVASCSVATAHLVGLAVGQQSSFDPTALGACFGFPANASSTDSAEYLVVAQSAAPTWADSSPFMLTGISSSGAAAATVAARRAWLPPARSAAAAFDGFLRSPDRPWNVPIRNSAAVRAAPSLVTPPVLGSLRTFRVCSNLTCGTTTPVTARVEAVGTNVAIYIDTLNPVGGPTAGLAPTDLDTLLQVMDTRIYPLDIQTFGTVSDLDANGVVIALMTPAVNRLVSRASCEQNGYIAGFFFPFDLTPGQSQQYNNGEVYYTIVPDPDSVESCPHSIASVKRVTGPTFAHELEHMINFAQHVLFRPGGAGPEEGWLDEGLARYAEELAARSFLPGDTATFHSYLVFGDLYDAYQYLLNPGGSYLEIINDNGTLAETGASWLFVRYLVDQYGPTLPAKLVQSGFTGAPNVVRHTTASSFQSLVANWALANFVSDLPGFTPASALTYTSWSFRAEYDTLNLFNPGRFPLPFPLVPLAVSGSAIGLTGELRSGSGWYTLAVQTPSAPAFALKFTVDGTTPLPTTVFPQLTVLRIR
jgi:hypothetical protein